MLKLSNQCVSLHGYFGFWDLYCMFHQSTCCVILTQSIIPKFLAEIVCCDLGLPPILIVFKPKTGTFTEEVFNRRNSAIGVVLVHIGGAFGNFLPIFYGRGVEQMSMVVVAVLVVIALLWNNKILVDEGLGQSPFVIGCTGSVTQCFASTAGPIFCDQV